MARDKANLHVEPFKHRKLQELQSTKLIRSVVKAEVESLTPSNEYAQITRLNLAACRTLRSCAFVSRDDTCRIAQIDGDGLNALCNLGELELDANINKDFPIFALNRSSEYLQSVFRYPKSQCADMHLYRASAAPGTPHMPKDFSTSAYDTDCSDPVNPQLVVKRLLSQFALEALQSMIFASARSAGRAAQIFNIQLQDALYLAEFDPIHLPALVENHASLFRFTGFVVMPDKGYKQPVDEVRLRARSYLAKQRKRTHL